MKTRIYYLFSYILILSIFSFQACQEETVDPVTFGKVNGKILLGNTNTPVEGVLIFTTPASSNSLSNNAGEFELENIPSGSIGLKAEKSGFITSTSNISVPINGTASTTIRLFPDTLSNTLPSAPVIVSPLSGSINVSIPTTFSWRKSIDPNKSDSLKYEITLFDSNNPNGMVIATNLRDTFFRTNTLLYNTNYFWQVNVKDKANIAINGSLAGFKTKDLPSDFRIYFAKKTNGIYNIFAGNDKGESIQITNGSSGKFRPKISPNRNKIAFIDGQGIDLQIYIMDKDGSNIKKVSSIPISGFSPSELDYTWAPDGNTILYMNNRKLFLVNIDGSNTRTFSDAPSGFTFTEVDWSANSNQVLARITGTNIFDSQILILDGNNGQAISQIVQNAPGNTGGPAYSINGLSFLYTQDIQGFESQDGRQLDSRIFVKVISTQSTADLSFKKISGTNDFDPRYSADGSKVIFVNTPNDLISQKDIYIMDITGENRKILFPNAEMPDWK
jgi:TolB protein